MNMKKLEMLKEFDSKPWEGLPPDPSEEAYRWLINDERGEVPCLWKPSSGMWQIWGDSTLYPPTYVVLAYRYGAKVMTMQAYGEFTKMIMLEIGDSWSL